MNRLIKLIAYGGLILVIISIIGLLVYIYLATN